MPARFSRLVLPLLLVCIVPAFAFVPPGTGDDKYVPPIQPASPEAKRQLSAFQIPEGMNASLIAAEPKLANPVAFSIDDQGRYWVCETFRQGNAVTDNRDRGYWLLDDLAAQTVEDRLEYYKEHLSDEELAAFTVHDDRIRLLTDVDGDGKIDKSTVFADGFHDPLEGTGAGVLKVGKDVFYTNIPNLWRLRDTNSDGRADERESMFYGFGVRTAFRGHDMHGLIVGPDGRLYFSIGDRGFNVVNQEGERLKKPATGAVLRCELDGSNLEIFAYGLRNPQELAFDNYGNLFTGDNNSDSGDQARWVHVVEGSDSGWRMYYQYLDDRGPWNREMMWYPYDSPPLDHTGPGGVPAGSVAKERQPAYILPPVANFASGPSGLVHYPGVGLSEEYDDHFFLCDFRGTPTSSGLRSLAVKPDGAGFKLVDSEEFIWRMLCTDVAFTPDGTLVLSDWVNGWTGVGKGRLYGFTDPDFAKEGKESARLLTADFSEWKAEKMVGLFSHPDQRVRQKAHLEVASRPAAEFPLAAIKSILEQGETIPSLHATWALSVSLRHYPAHGFERLKMLAEAASPSSEPKVRAQAIRGLFDVHWRVAQAKKIPLDAGTVKLSPDVDEAIAQALDGLLEKPNIDPRVRREAILGYGRSFRTYHFNKQKEAVQISFIRQLLKIAADEGANDPVLRHAVQAALGDSVDAKLLVSIAKDHESPLARAGAVVALRRMKSPQVAAFLADDNPDVVAEAARAINDVPIDAATKDLAALAGHNDLNTPTLRRLLNANFRLGTRKNAEAVVAIAANSPTPPKLRIEAIDELKLWHDPPKLDRVTGMYRPVEPREADFLADVVRPQIDELLAADSDDVRIAAIELAAQYKLSNAMAKLRAIARDTGRGDDERIAALNALANLASNKLQETLAFAVEDKSAAVRSAGRTIWARIDPVTAVPALERTIREGELIEKQAAIKSLAEFNLSESDAVLSKLFEKLEKGKLPPGIQLEVLEAAASRPSLKSRAQAFIKARSGDPKTAYAAALVGGDSERGSDIFFNRESVSCQRCHKVDGRGGEVGPDLSHIAKERDRNYLLQAIVDPNEKIAENFESVIVVTADGLVKTGVKRAEDKETLTIITAEAKVIKIPKVEIAHREPGESAMPEDLLKHLSKRDIRDLVEFLARQE